MYLKHLTISGFKSFAKKSELEFSAPITSIVGPNGSGKSNVAESFRFVLGEQSMKSMRGKKGGDLIFNGSDATSRSNKASVSIILDNSKRVFPMDFDEITLERTVYRDGQNEYQINGSKVRLKDVQELLSAANIGPTGHHIISQGEADRILSASAKERREMIEDALGLKVFQYKRIEAEKKLKKTQANIEKVQSLRREVAPHLKFLERQVKKIERAIALRSELTTVYAEYLKREDTYIAHHSDRLRLERTEPAQKLEALKEQLIAAKKVLSESENDEKSSALIPLQEELATIRMERQTLLRKGGQLEGQVSFLERRIRQAKEKSTSESEAPIPIGEVKKILSTIEKQVDKALRAIAHRGRDAKKTLSISSGALGHVLHAMVDLVPQPVTGRGVLLFNGEIYNWKELNIKYSAGCSNDAQLLLFLLDSMHIDDFRHELDGVYAFAYFRDDKVIIERDLLGVKPLWYSNSPFAFASERKALEAVGISCRELHPRTTLTYDIRQEKLTAKIREFSFPKTNKSLEESLFEAVKKRIPESNKIGVLFSGGIDSSLIAMLAKKAGADITLYVAALDDPLKKIPHDIALARKSADKLGLKLVEIRADSNEVEQAIPEVCRLIEDSGVVKVGVALPFYFCARKAHNDGLRVLFSGLGAEEVFAGYQRHKQAIDINKECLRGLRRMHERDLYRDDVIAMSCSIEMRLPLLDREVISKGLSIESEKKIVSGIGKMPLRKAAVKLGLPEEIAMKRKKAAQYGSQFDAGIRLLAKKKGLSKSEYLRAFYPVNGRLAALLSSGKDSVYSIYIMKKLNYSIECAVTINSDNPDSYMYHTPLTNVALLQAKSMGIPIITKQTTGKKEAELKELREALKQAVEEHRITGVVCGALYSDYQRARLEIICEELGVQLFAPLWHLDQEQAVREMIDSGFVFIISKVAAEGLDKSWVGRIITHKDVDKLKKLLHINVAGEGGEYESLVIDCPLFSKKVVLTDKRVVCEGAGASGDVCVLSAKACLE